MLDFKNYIWKNQPDEFLIEDNRIEIVTKSYTDLWQKTFGGECKNDAAMLLWNTTDKNFIFTVKAVFQSSGRCDQAGVCFHKDEDTWLKAGLEFENGIKHLGGVLTNHGYSDWSAVDLPYEKTTMWYRLNRRGDDFMLMYSEDGEKFSILRLFHVWDLDENLQFGLYAASPDNSSFKVVFTDMKYEVEN